MHEKNLWRIVLSCLLVVTVMAGVSISALAQGPVPMTATPQPLPTNNGGSAQWTVNKETFSSQFPKGATFTIDATSSAGKIASAGVLWRHGTDAPTTRRPGVIDPKTGMITTVWEAGQDAVPQWVSFEYWWVLTDTAGNTYTTPHKFDDYSDSTHGWHHAESDDIVVYWEDGIDDSIGQLVIDKMKQMRPVYKQAWGRLLDYKPRAILYADYATWEEWDSGVSVSATDANGNSTIIQGLTDYRWGGTAQVIDPQGGVQRLALGVVPHEVDHLYQHFNGGTAQECWFIEGDATSFEDDQEYDYLARVQDIAASGNLASLQNGGPSCRGSDARDAYDIGYAFWKWLAATYGDDAHYKVWNLIANGSSIDDALKNVTSEDFVTMETDFRSWLGMANAAPPTALPTLSFQFQATPTYEPTASQ